MILTIMSFLFILFLSQIAVLDAFSNSPYFSELEFIDNTPMINMATKNKIKNGERYTDITSVNVFSDGKTLNATLWLLSFKEKPSLKEVDYGMLIDADLNHKTGYGGIDYKVEIQWNNETKNWGKLVERWSHSGSSRTIENITNYTNFYERGGQYVTVSLDLKKISYPQKYKVLFYADFRKNDDILISDFLSSSIILPPVDYDISTNPISIELSRGISGNIEIKANSTEQIPLFINFIIENKPKETFFDLQFNNLTLPYYGIGTTQLTVTPTKDALLGRHTFFIIARSVPLESSSIFQENSYNGALGKNEEDASKITEFYNSIPPTNQIEMTPVSVVINKEHDFFDNIKLSWEKVGDFAQFIYGIIAGLSPFIYQQIRKFTNHNTNNTNKN